MRNLEIKQLNKDWGYKGTVALVAGSIILFCLYPILKIIGTSFFVEEKFSLKLYDNIFIQNWGLLKNTIFTSVLSAGGSTLIAGTLAFYIIFSKSWRGKFLYYFLLMTMISPPFVFGLSCITLFGRRGLITYRLLGMSLNPYGWTGIVFLQMLGEISFAAFLMTESLRGLDNKLILASRSLGASSWETIKRIVFPFSLTGIWGVFFIIFTKNIADFGTPIIMGGRYSTLATEAYLTVIGKGEMAKASAMTTLLLIPALGAFFLYRKNLEKNSGMVSEGKGGGNFEFSLELPIILKLFLGTMALTFFIIMALQYGAICISGFYNYTTRGFEFTTEHLERFWLGKYETFVRSIVYSLIAATFSAAVGILLSYFTERRGILGMKGIEFCASLPYILPGTFFGLGYILAFNKAPLSLTGTAAIVVLNCVFRQVSIGSKAGNALFSRIDRNLEKAAQDLGASQGKIMTDIMLPLVKPAFTAAFVNGFTTTMTTTGSIIFLISPGASVATIEMFNTIRDGDYGLAAIIALAIIFVTFFVNIIAIRRMRCI
jgi:iron(III) transport system permease protein